MLLFREKGISPFTRFSWYLFGRDEETMVDEEEVARTEIKRVILILFII